MGMIDDILKALDRIPAWKRLQEVPSEIDELKERVAALEEKLGDKWPGDVCRYCGTRAARLSGTRGAGSDGMIHEFWHCENCGETDHRTVKAK